MMKTDIIFSVIIPVYNKESSLEKCLNSLIAQYKKNCELILVDDGSTDNSLAICKKYKEKYNNINIISQKNRGCVAAREQGILNSKGRYITFVDADDYVADNYFYVLNKIVENNAELYILNNYINRGKNSQFHLENNFKNEGLISYEDACLKIMCGVSPVVWNKIYIGDILRNIKFRRYINYGDDIYINIEYLKCITTIYCTNEAVYYYYADSPTSICANDKVYKKLKEQRIVYLEGMTFLQERDLEQIIPPFSDAIRRTYAVAIYDLEKSGESKKSISKEIFEHEITKNAAHTNGIKAIINWLIVNKKFYKLAMVQELLRKIRFNRK